MKRKRDVSSGLMISWRRHWEMKGLLFLKTADITRVMKISVCINTKRSWHSRRPALSLYDVLSSGKVDIGERPESANPPTGGCSSTNACVTSPE